MGVTAGC